MARVYSDPHMYLRPLYRELTQSPAFALLSTDTKFDLLVDAVARESATQAAHLRAYTHAARAGLLGHLASMESQRPAPRQVALWTAQKEQRVLECGALYLPHGVDLRLVEDGEVRRTQLMKDGPHAEQLADEWLAAAVKLGWAVPPPGGS